MILTVHLAGSLFGLSAVFLGAFGTHMLKRSLSETQLRSYGTGVRYQFYHALLLLVLGFNLEFATALETAMAYCFITGILLFSFSIFGWSFGLSRGKKYKLLIRLTPVGGAALISGWAMLTYYFIADLL